MSGLRLRNEDGYGFKENEIKYVNEEVYIENEDNRFIIFNLETGDKTIYSDKHYHLWWAVYMTRNYGTLPLHCNKTQNVLIRFTNVNGKNGGETKRIKSMREANEVYLKNLKENNEEKIKVA